MSDEDDAELAAIDGIDPDKIPEPAPRPRSKPPVPSADSAREVTTADDLASSPNANGENGSGAQLLALAFAFHPFMVLFERLAVARHPRKQSKRACVDAHANLHPALYRFCVVADLVGISAIVLIFIGTLAVGSYKTLFGHF